MFPPSVSSHGYSNHPPQATPRSTALATRQTDAGALPESDPILEGLRLSVLREFEVDKGVDGKIPVKLENFSSLGSYSWIDAPQPTISVPGSPREWREPRLPFRVLPDSGPSVFDPSGYLMRSRSKLIPLFRAVDVLEEHTEAEARTDWSAVDLVLDRSSMRKLLRWVRYADPDKQTPQAPPPPFRLDFELAGDRSVLVDRWDMRTYEMESAGYRRNFDKATTSPRFDERATKYHHRIVQYDLEGLSLVVRFEADACMPDDEDDPADLLANLTLTSSSSPPFTAPAPSSSSADADMTIAVVRGGPPVPHSSLIEITTRSSKSREHHKWHETYTQLFLSQTHHFFLGVHERGTFHTIEKYRLDASPEFAWYEKDECMQRSLRQLVRLLETIQELVMEHGPEGRLSLVCREGKLELFERAAGEGGACRLPDSELARFRW
ncbi:hypothetical protein BN946_scf184970.g108 [Trametes cinnabarina]|uniref:Decapping nuclease n=1 Tax=Pycnoporus cinnabarinus TaxID=5643 RepID=A0A060SDG4_PYCCI|nr:hypothetical protein BN946_scf184970.g108 [Trametes cinnabarina]